jgi:hypothetical protein
MPIPSPTYPKAKARKKPPMAMALPVRPGPIKGLPAAPAAPRPPQAAAGAVRPNTPPVASSPPVFGQAPHSVQGDTIRNDAQTAMAGANSNWHDAVFRAVMGLGDPTLINKYRSDPAFAGYNFVADPTSTFGQLDTQQQRGMQDIMGNALRGNTAMSGLRLNNENNLANDILTQKAGAGRSFEDALLDYARTLGQAQGDFNTSNFNANQADIDAWAQLHPQPAGPPATKAAAGPTPAQRAANAAAQARNQHAAAVAAARKKAKKK